MKKWYVIMACLVIAAVLTYVFLKPANPRDDTVVLDRAFYEELALLPFEGEEAADPREIAYAFLFGEAAGDIFPEGTAFDYSVVETLLNEEYSAGLSDEKAAEGVVRMVAAYAAQQARNAEEARQREIGASWKGVSVSPVTVKRLGSASGSAIYADPGAAKWLANVLVDTVLYTTGVVHGDFLEVIYHDAIAFIREERVEYGVNLVPLNILDAKRYELPGGDVVTLAYMGKPDVLIRRESGGAVYLAPGAYLIMARDDQNSSVWVYDLAGQPLGWSNYGARDGRSEYFLIERLRLTPSQRAVFDEGTAAVIAAGFRDVSAQEEAAREQAARDAAMASAGELVSAEKDPLVAAIQERNDVLANLERYIKELESGRADVAALMNLLAKADGFAGRARQEGDDDLIAQADAARSDVGAALITTFTEGLSKDAYLRLQEAVMALEARMGNG